MIYVIQSILSLLLIGSTTFIGYRLFNWAFFTADILLVNIVYLVWFIIVFSLALINGASIHKYIVNKKELELFSHIIAIIWVVSILAIAVYVWFKQPYTTGMIITRAIWSYLLFALAAVTYLMIRLMYDTK